MGDYFCPNCNFSRPNAEFIASDICLNGVESSKACFSHGGGSIEIDLNLPGTYNIYNALGAFAAANSLGISDEPIGRSLKKSTAAFGRTEKLVFNSRKICLFLTKNPTGLSQVIETLKLDNNQKNLLLCLNDNYADGIDVSWIWDVDIEEIDKFARSIVCSGSRAHDMALRIKYTGYDSSRIDVENRIMPAFMRAANRIDKNETLYVLATYTAMLELRKHLTNSGSVSAFWKAS
jgi:UDP-N-acetylmuramyl tripeptide synthase